MVMDRSDVSGAKTSDGGSNGDEGRLVAQRRFRRSPKIAELVAQEIAETIVDTGLPEGTSLGTERDLVERYGVGRTTMREALRLLETRGVISIRSGPGGGIAVRRPEPSDLGEPLSLVLQFSGTTLADVLAARQILDPVLATHAATAATEAALVAMEEIIARAEEMIEDDVTFLTQSLRFHTAIARASGNVVLDVIYQGLEKLSTDALRGATYPRQYRNDVLEAHKGVLESLRAREPEAARERMQSHIEAERGYWGNPREEIYARRIRWSAL
jgi:DNA-binding FadR family transcriptional regulator